MFQRSCLETEQRVSSQGIQPRQEPDVVAGFEVPQHRTARSACFVYMRLKLFLNFGVQAAGTKATYDSDPERHYTFLSN